jgi:hypothetical protein
MSHQSNQMRASVTSYAFCNKEEEKKETDKELSDDDNSDN